MDTTETARKPEPLEPSAKKSKTSQGTKRRPPVDLHGFTVHECGRDGACGYNALAAAVAMSKGGLHPKVQDVVTMGRTLRQAIKAHIEKHAKDYQPRFAVSSKWTETTEGGPVRMARITTPRQTVDLCGNATGCSY